MNWRDRLDARISRCPDCDEWCWDHWCHQCDPDGLACDLNAQGVAV